MPTGIGLSKEKIVKLVASLIVAAHEHERYLVECLDSLAEFTDEIRIVIDDDCESPVHSVFSWKDHPNCMIMCNPRTRFFEHEGQARQRLLEWTLAGDPTHILSIDCDEFVSDGPALRHTVEQAQEVSVWTMPIEEVWNASPGGLSIRVDGGWKIGSNFLYRAPDSLELRQHASQWRILDQALACGRNPMAIRRLSSRPSGVSLLHFGWTNKAERDKRYQRYVEHDGGNFHSRKHLDSIMWPDGKIMLRNRSWPNGLTAQKANLLRRAA